MPTVRKTRSHNSGVRVEKHIDNAIVGKLNTCIRYAFDVRCWDGTFISIVRYTMLMGVVSIKNELSSLRKFLHSEVQQHMWDSHDACDGSDPFGHDDSYYKLEEDRIISGIVAGLEYIAKNDCVIDEGLRYNASSVNPMRGCYTSASPEVGVCALNGYVKSSQCISS